MTDDEEAQLGRSTRSGLSYVQRLILHMIDNGIPEMRFPNMDVTFDFTTIPFMRAKSEKILKAIRHWSESGEEHRIQFFHFYDPDTDADYVFTFRLVDQDRYVQVNMVDVPADPA